MAKAKNTTMKNIADTKKKEITLEILDDKEVSTPDVAEITVEGTTTIDGITSLNPVIETEIETKEEIITIEELSDEDKKIEVEVLSVEEAEVFIDKSFLKKLQRVKNEYIFSMNMTGNYKMALAIENLNIKNYRSEDAIRKAINDLSK